MKGIIKLWKGLAYWKRGGIIGFTLPLLIIILASITGSYPYSGFPFGYILIIMSIPTFFIFFGFKLVGILSLLRIGLRDEYGVETAIALGVLSTPIFYCCLGILIGWLYKKYKDKKHSAMRN